jgi:hypothetical protein
MSIKINIYLILYIYRYTYYCLQKEISLEEKYKTDIMKLKKIFENQMQQKYLFQNDIKNLRLKMK